MALTRPRASQIYDIDYKQATRVVTVASITLAGGAPSAVDGVNLSSNDRVLVTGQATASQNGIYYVTTVGTGSNGTWTRSLDTDTTGELLAGTVVMVTEGVIYADTQWKLTTNDPIVIGSTALAFVQNYSANSISSGNSNVIVYSNANVSISSNGVSNVVAINNTGEYVVGLISATGNLYAANLSTVTSNTDIRGWWYSGNSFSVAAQELNPTDVQFNSSGNTMYIVGSANRVIYQYGLSSPWNITTASYSGLSANVNAQDTVPNGIAFNSTGNTMWMVGSTNRVVYQYTLSDTANIATLTYSGLSANVNAQETAPTGIAFDSTQANLYVIGTTADTIFQYTLSTPGNIATATYLGKSLSTASQEATGQALAFNSSGTVVYIVGNTFDRISAYNLSTPWDISTGTFYNNMSVQPQDGTATGLAVNLAQEKVWIVGQVSDAVYQYNTGNSTILTGNSWYVGANNIQTNGNLYVAQQFVANGVAQFYSTTTVNNTLTATALTTTTITTTTGAVNMQATTAVINIGYLQTTGALILGGPTQTGNITVGQATSNSNLSIANGATSSGNTKTVGIGINGAAGSNTVITVGPAAGNGNITFTANTTVAIANTSATALSVAGNITGANVLTAGLISATSTITSAANVIGGNITTNGQVSATGNATVGNISATNHTGTTVSVTGNVTGSYFIGNGSQLSSVTGANVTGTVANATFAISAGTATSATTAGTVTTNAQANITSVGTLTSVTVTGNVVGGNITTAGLISVAGSITTGDHSLTGNIVDTGTLWINTGANGNINLNVSGTGQTNIPTGILSVTGNIQAGNLRTAGLVTATGNVTGGNVLTAGLISATANITGSNLLTGGLISATSTIVSSNYIKANNMLIVESQSPQAEGGQITLAWPNISGITGQANSTWNIDVDNNNALRLFYQNATSATNIVLSLNSTNQNANFSGNIGASYYYGNGSQLTGITVTAGSQILNGNSNVTVAANSNVTVAVTGANIVTFASTGEYITGVLSVSGNITGNNILSTGLLSAAGTIQSAGAIITQTATGRVATGTDGGGSLSIGFSANNATATTPYIDFNTSATVVDYDVRITASGNTGTVAGGTLTISAANVAVSSILSATGNIQGGNIRTAGLITATGNVFGNSAVFSGNTAQGALNTFTDTAPGAGSSALIRINNGTNFLNIIPNVGAGSFNGLTAANDTLLYFYNTTSGNGNLTLSPWAGGTTGIKISSVSNVATITLAGTTISATGNIAAGTGNITAGNVSVSTGTITVGNIVNANANAVGNIGSASLYFNTAFVKATSAQYADLAEYYVADQDYAPGTVLVFGGAAEVTASNITHDTRVAGVVSTDPAYIMNAQATGLTVALALTGRVPCQVQGPVTKGDRLVNISTGTAGRVDLSQYQPGCIIGKSLETIEDSSVRTIEIAVGRY